MVVVPWRQERGRGGGSAAATAVVVKQALPYVRCVGPSWPLSTSRASFEHQALLEQKQYCPQHVPAVHCLDPVHALFCMQFIDSPPHEVLRKRLLDDTPSRCSSSVLPLSPLPLLADHLSTYLADCLFRSSIFCLGSSNSSGGDSGRIGGSELFQTKVSFWSKNRSMCALTEQVIFSDPYSHDPPSPFNRCTPGLEDFAAHIRSDHKLKLFATKLKVKFLSTPQALLHGDLHTGSIMVGSASAFVIDPEFAFYGPMGFDLGLLLGNLLIAFFARAVKAATTTVEGVANEAGSSDFADWILGVIVNMLDSFFSKFELLWGKNLSIVYILGGRAFSFAV